jgi:hypothetical protein
MDFDEIKLYLPKYLSPSSEKALFDELKQFPKNIDSRVYSESVRVESIMYQGDGIKGLLVTDLPDKEIHPTDALILTNTCDMSLENKRLFPTHICYSPIIKLNKYKNRLIERGVASEEIVEKHIENIKNQKIAQILFLPCGGSLQEDALIFFNRISSCSLRYLINDDIVKIKLFSLSNYGLYLFLFKLSLHFTRIAEGKDRDK